MSLWIDKLGRSLLVVPRDYQQVRPHHLVVLYATYTFITSTTFYKSLSNKFLGLLSKLAERCIPLIQIGLVPDFVIRFGIRLQTRDRLAQLASVNAETELQQKMDIVQQLRTMPIAIETGAANKQHYEVPARFYDLCLGPRKKYSSGLWPSPQTTFEESEVLMMDLYCERAQIKDGMKLCDLGCGWGSLTLHLAERFPNAKITGISNSHSQRDYILKTASERGLNVDNITIITV